MFQYIVFSFVADAPPVLEEPLAGMFNVVRRILPCVCESARHVEVGSNLGNIPFDDEAPWAEELCVGLHARER